MEPTCSSLITKRQGQRSGDPRGRFLPTPEPHLLATADVLARAGGACGLSATPPFKMHLCGFETIQWPDCREYRHRCNCCPGWGFSEVAPAGEGEDFGRGLLMLIDW